MVRLLLDTHIFLWVVNQSPRLNAKTRSFLESAAAIYVSSASIWEIAIKVRLGKMKADPDAMLSLIGASGFKELPVLGRHATGVAKLPLHHGDPFDRLLVAQAISELMHLVTEDPHLAAYSDLVITV
jgi:PIN domain nuclease of toxin-antitoxin system